MDLEEHDRELETRDLPNSPHRRAERYADRTQASLYPVGSAHEPYGPPFGYGIKHLAERMLEPEMREKAAIAIALDDGFKSWDDVPEAVRDERRSNALAALNAIFKALDEEESGE